MGTVYFVNGFLEAGKTTFIKELIGRESFRISGKTLILLCEEGDLEYDDEELAGANAVLEIIEKEEGFNEDTIAALEKKTQTGTDHRGLYAVFRERKKRLKRPKIAENSLGKRK